MRILWIVVWSVTTCRLKVRIWCVPVLKLFIPILRNVWWRRGTIWFHVMKLIELNWLSWQKVYVGVHPFNNFPLFLWKLLLGHDSLSKPNSACMHIVNMVQQRQSMQLRKINIENNKAWIFLTGLFSVL